MWLLYSRAVRIPCGQGLGDGGQKLASPPPYSWRVRKYGASWVRSPTDAALDSSVSFL
jgi:hypothetical protein